MILNLAGVLSLIQPYAGPLANDQAFLNIVAAGSKAESNWDTDAINTKTGCAKGFFQFNTCGGLGTGWALSDLIGITGAQKQAQTIVPVYASAYRRGVSQGLSGQDLATFVIGDAERPDGWKDGAVKWDGQSYSNYVTAWQTIQPGVTTPVPIPGQSQMPGQTQTPAQTQQPSTPTGGVHAGQIGSFPISVPSGLVLGLVAALMLILGALMFGFNVQNRVKATATDAIGTRL